MNWIEFVPEIVSLRAQQPESVLSHEETELLLAINQGLPQDMERRWDELIVKRDAETLTTEEYAELLRLTDEVEELDAQRMENLLKLAEARNTTLRALMESLGIPARRADPGGFRGDHGKARAR